MVVALITLTPRVVLAGGDSECIGGCGDQCDQPPPGASDCATELASCPVACECKKISDVKCECSF